jgi:hypothetical protein
LLTRARTAIAPSILFLFICSVTYAQGEPQRSQGQPAPAEPAPKQPAPPLFPRHRRGIYTNLQGIEVVDATPQSPPLETDDPGVPDKGEWEINLSTFADLAKNATRVDLLFVDANYGLLPKIAGHELPTQLKIEFPVSAAEAHGDPFAFGIGAATLGVKFNFYTNEQTGLSMSVYPQVEFVPPGTPAVDKGLAEPGRTLIFPVLVAKEFHEFTFVANGGIEQSLHSDEGTPSGVFSVGFGRALTRRVAAEVEVRGETAFASGGDRLWFLNVGVMRGIHDVVLYAKAGHSLASNDEGSHMYLGGGIKLLIQPPGKKDRK